MAKEAQRQRVRARSAEPGAPREAGPRPETDVAAPGGARGARAEAAPEPAPAGGPGARDDHGRRIRRAFSEIAPRYDLLNHLLSLNIDRIWRRRAVDRLGWERAPEGLYLDSCAGTLDLGVELARRPGFRGTVIACDFARAMLERGRWKLAGLPVRPACADALRMPFPDGVFDGAMVAFGLRNLADAQAGLEEFARVLKPEARLVVLEFTLPASPLVRGLYLVYFRRVLPLVGRVISGHPWAYSYLPASVLDFPGPVALAERMVAAGFSGTRWELLLGGIAAIHTGRRAGGRGLAVRDP
ncbi:MAG: ubiquinone/menaquinone biosynthesis methyltransferase [Gemmatimonadetes bacterium]|nr:ubiquinone/menaquinone biosynthesis methyltransferase [Gemmatimonadota bacterium]